MRNEKWTLTHFITYIQQFGTRASSSTVDSEQLPNINKSIIYLETWLTR